MNNQVILLERKCQFPFIRHIGLKTITNGEEVVYHNTAIKKNEYGGNIVAMPLEEFLSIGELISTTPTNVDPNFLRQFSFDKRFQKYRVYYF